MNCNGSPSHPPKPRLQPFSTCCQVTHRPSQGALLGLSLQSLEGVSRSSSKPWLSFAVLRRVGSLPVAKAKDHCKYRDTFARLTLPGISEAVHFQGSREAGRMAFSLTSCHLSSPDPGRSAWSQNTLSHSPRFISFWPSSLSQSLSTPSWLDGARERPFLLSAETHFFPKLK